MPPAFNLSQDQTLQFNLCKLSSKLTWKNQFHVSIRVFLFAKHHIAYATQRRPPTPNAHTYRLLIFKEQAFNELCILAQSLHILQETLKKPVRRTGFFMNRVSDDVLLSRARSPLSSAQKRFTFLFGMGRGGSTSLWSSDKACWHAAWPCGRATCPCLVTVDDCIELPCGSRC